MFGLNHKYHELESNYKDLKHSRDVWRASWWSERFEKDKLCHEYNKSLKEDNEIILKQSNKLAAKDKTIKNLDQARQALKRRVEELEAENLKRTLDCMYNNIPFTTWNYGKGE